MEVSEISNRILSDLLEARTGQQLTPSRRWRIGTALSGLFRERGISSADQLIGLLTQAHEASLARRVVEALLNNETYFFRDRAIFDQLATRVLPEIAEHRAYSRRLSIWSAGCSTGQEALSLAMLIEQDPRWTGWTIAIGGPDASESVIDLARGGLSTPFPIQRGPGGTQMARWVDAAPDGWRAADPLRARVRFRVHNLLGPPLASGAGRFDLILCRNVLLYFDGPNRARAFDRLASALAPDGRLLLGAGETVMGQTDRFAPDARYMGVYCRDDAGPQALRRRAGFG